jgi:predicted transposase YbfD/YdcC
MPVLKENQAELRDWAEYLLQYPADQEHHYHEVRSGWVWVWRVRSTAQIPPGKELFFPGLQQIVEIHRHKTHKRTGVRVQETGLYVTSLSPAQADATTLARISRGHWAIENRLHHKRDVALGEDACRTRKAAQAMAALRNLLLGFLHQLGVPVLRTIRRFAVKPMSLYRWLSGCRCIR